MKIKIPRYGKIVAKKALEKRKSLPKSKKFGLTKKEADKLGISSGVERAKQIIKSKYMPEKDARKICRFYQRFKNCKTPKCVGAVNLWGGKKWGRVVCKQLYKLK